jgi:Vitamin K-dependent gamma-carboxylase
LIGSSSSNRATSEEAAQVSVLRRVFAIDLRSLAVWRLALALLVLLDVRLRWPVAESLYSDAGWLTRDLAGTLHRQLAGEVPAHAIWSVLWLDGSALSSRLALAVMALAAIPFLVGWKTRFCNVVLWILVASIHARNPLVTTSADMLLKLMLMWGMFLPLGRVWSVDARRRSEPADHRPVFSLASAGLILQLVQLYVFSGIAKLNGAWLDGTAMEYVLRLDIYTTAFGQRLLDFPRLVSGIAWGTLALELGVVWLVLVPWRSAWPRIVTLSLFWSFHAGIALTMQIGLFCPICMSIWLVTIPAGFWDRMNGRAKSPVPHSVSDSGMPAWASSLCVLLTVWTLCWNIGQVAGSRFPGFLRTPLALLGRILAVDQNFQMFGQLHQENSWFVFRATLADGSEADLLRGVAPPVWEKPPRVAATIPDHNWRKLLDNLTQERFAAYRQPLLESVVRDWNRRHEPERQVVAAELVKLSQPIGPGFNGIDQKSAVWATAGQAFDRPGSRFDEMLRRMKEGTGPSF